MIDTKTLTLVNYPKETLAEIWNTLNNWEWHSLLGEKPEDWDYLPNFKFTENHKNATKKDIINPYNRQIEEQIGTKECLRYLNVSKGSKTNFEFELFWIKNKLEKIFKTGIYSKAGKRQMKSLLNEVKMKDQQEWVKDNFK
jgi:hypothetical protein